MKMLYNVYISNLGEFWPEECNPSFSTAVIVPYRNRAAQLKQFLGYIHNFLRKQNIHYKIFVIEQSGSDNDNNSFNRAKLFNIGAKVSLQCRSIDDFMLTLHNFSMR